MVACRAYNKATHPYELETVERNCLYTTDAWLLAWMARELGRPRDAQELERGQAAMAGRINQLLWDERRRCYFNRRWAPQDGNCFESALARDIFLSHARPGRPEGTRRGA